jgi:galactokinase
MRVLVFDDEEYKAKLVEAWIDIEGIDCICDIVHTETEFHQKINEKNANYDFLLIDYYLNGSITGYDIAKQYIANHPSCDIVIYSAYKDSLNSVSDFKKTAFDGLQQYIKDNMKTNRPEGSVQPYQIYEIKEIRKDIESQEKRINKLFDIYEDQDNRVREFGESVAEQNALIEKHTKINSENEIPDLCKNIFITQKKFLSTIWIVAGLLLGTGTGCIAWAMATNSSITELKQTQIEEKAKVAYLQNEVNKKLDILIKRGEQQKRITEAETPLSGN